MNDSVVKYLRENGFHTAADFLFESRPFKIGDTVQWTKEEMEQIKRREVNKAMSDGVARLAGGLMGGEAKLTADGPQVARGQERVPPVDLGMFSMWGLQHAVDQRSVHIDPEGRLGALFFATELGGECGEALNVVKKLERERMGIDGSRDDVEHLAKELSDTIITCCNVARCYGIALQPAIVETFNRTSAERHLPVMLK